MESFEVTPATGHLNITLETIGPTAQMLWKTNYYITPREVVLSSLPQAGTLLYGKPVVKGKFQWSVLRMLPRKMRNSPSTPNSTNPKGTGAIGRTDQTNHQDPSECEFLGCGTDEDERSCDVKQQDKRRTQLCLQNRKCA